MNTYKVDVAYQQDESVCAAGSFIPNWPSSTSAFLAASAKAAQPGSRGQLHLSAFTEWLSAFALGLPASSSASLRLNLCSTVQGIDVQYSVMARDEQVEIPLEADNPGFITGALSWFAEHRPDILLHVADGLFWIEGEK